MAFKRGRDSHGKSRSAEKHLPNGEKLPDLKFLSRFIPSQELSVLKENLEGEERSYFIKMLNELEQRIKGMPCDRTELTMESPVLLHLKNRGFANGKD